MRRLARFTVDVEDLLDRRAPGFTAWQEGVERVVGQRWRVFKDAYDAEYDRRYPVMKWDVGEPIPPELREAIQRTQSRTISI